MGIHGESGSYLLYGLGAIMTVVLCIVELNPTLLLMTENVGKLLSTYNWTLKKNKPRLDQDTTNELPLCNWTLGEEGRWVYDNASADAGLRYPVFDDCIIHYNYACQHGDKDYLENLRPRMTEAMNWVWKPTSCWYVRLDVEEFLKRFQGRRFIMLGDSINTEWSHSFRCQLMRKVKVKPLEKEGLKNGKCLLLSDELKAEEKRDRQSLHPKLNDSYFPKTLIDHPAVDTRALQCIEPSAYQFSVPNYEPVTIMSMDARFMGALAAWHDLSFSDGRSRLREWWQIIIDSNNPTHIMWNTGMHWTNIPNAVEQMTHLARKTAVDLRDIFNGTLIFRTSMGNIKRCGDLEKPLMTYEDASEDQYIDYNWGDLEIYNKIWEEEFKNDDKFLLLSTRPYGLLPFGRRDGHDDCAHSCLPGPYDTWAGDWFWTILQQSPT